MNFANFKFLTFIPNLRLKLTHNIENSSLMLALFAVWFRRIGPRVVTSDLSLTVQSLALGVM